jgi:dynein heavy chain 2
MVDQSIHIHHQAASQFPVSPQVFINLVESYSHMLKHVNSTSGGQVGHLKAGLSKLQEAKKTVDKLSIEANEKAKLLTVKQAEANKAMERIQVSMEKKAERKQEVESLQAHTKEAEVNVIQRKQMVEQELGGIQPEVDAARAAVGDLKPANLTEIKNFRVPPDPVTHVLGAVMQFLGQTDISWNAMKRFLSNAGVIGQILNYDAMSVTPAIRNKVQKIITQYPNSFEASEIRRVSVAAAPLAAWAKANVKYSEVLLKIEPLTSELDALQSKLA